MGFGLPARIGVTASYLAVSGASALAGLVALAVGDARVPAPMPVASGLPALAPMRLRVVAAGSGALGLGLEVLWTRLFAQVLHNSVYSFAAVALVFLLALAAGAALSALLLRRTASAAVAGGALLGAAAATVGGIWLFVRSTDGLAYVGMQTGLGEYVLRIVGLAAAAPGPGALASGAVLPALWAAFGDRDGAARPLGELTAANTLGAVGGALAAGSGRLPAVRLRAGGLLPPVPSPGPPAPLAPARVRRRPLGYAALLALVALDPVRTPLTHLASGETLRALVEGPAGILTGGGTGDELPLRPDNH